MRPANCGNTFPSSEARKTSPCAASFRSFCNTPNSNSSTVIADTNCAATDCDEAQASTLGLDFRGWRNSDKTLVSRTNIRINRRPDGGDPHGALQTPHPSSPVAPERLQAWSSPQLACGIPRYSTKHGTVCPDR